MIRAMELGKQFEEFWAVRDVSLTVPKGEVLALLGPNGAGKTTTVRMLTSILRPTEGRAWIDGIDVTENPNAVRAKVGVLTEHHGLYGRMAAKDYLDFFAQIYGLDESTRRKRIANWLEMFGLDEFQKQRIGEFSKGMRQKLALARALLHEPPVLLLDEPTSAMDPESANLVRKAIQSLRSKDRAIILCTHNLVEAQALADRIAIIRKGRIIALGSLVELSRRFLGAPIFQVDFTQILDGRVPQFPDSVTVLQQGETWVQFSCQHPEETNPLVAQNLVAAGWPILQLREIPQSLEEIYLQAVKILTEEQHALS